MKLPYLRTEYVNKAQAEQLHWTWMPSVLLFLVCFIGLWEFTKALQEGVRSEKHMI